MASPTSRTTAIAAGCVLAATGLILSIPFLALGAGTGPDGNVSAPCPPNGPTAADDGTPPILGPAEADATHLQAWWRSSRRGQPPRLSAPIDRVIAAYISEGQAEGVRGDLAFAQAVVETGWFTNSDTTINNFAGIAHYDHAASGRGFPTARIGVRAQIQLLRKYVEGNGARLAHPDVSPNAGARATTWGQLAGRWATDTGYWSTISTVFESVRAGSSGAPGDGGGPAASICPASSEGPTLAGDYALPVNRIWWERHPEWFTKPHHDYPAADIPVPTGTPLYAITSGTIVATPTSGRCGIGVVLNGDDGAQYTYCHGQPGSHRASSGVRVRSGQLLMKSASTGNSTGPHLHLSVRADGVPRCPQPLLRAIATNMLQSPITLDSSGCVS